MERIHRLMAILVVSLLTGPTAVATAAPATDFNGLYELTYEDTYFNLHLCLDGQCAYVDLAAVGNMIDQDDVDQLDDELTQTCLQSSPEWVCDLLVDPIVELATEYAVTVSNAMPDRADLAVNPNPIMFLWWSTGLHNMTITAEADQYDPQTLQPTGQVVTGQFPALLSNRGGGSNGRFLALGFDVGQVGAVDGLACVTAGAAAVTGQIDRNADFEMGATYVGDMELICVLDIGVPVSVINVGIGLEADFLGER